MSSGRMRSRKRVMALVLAVLLCMAALVPTAQAASPQLFSFEDYYSHYDDFDQLLVGNVETGDIYYEKNGDQAHAIASMSKLMTYYVVREAMTAGKISHHDQVTISANAASFNRAGSSNYGLKEGDRFTVDRLLTGMMVVSGNDAAVALAEHVAGSEQAFVQEMNQAAQDLGLKSAHFVNASGLTLKDGTYSEASSEDMFILSQALLKKYPEVASYGKIRELREPERHFAEPSTFEESGMNQLEGFNGLKSGYTDNAGVCMTSYNIIKSQLTDREFHIITVVMGAHNGTVRRETTQQALALVSSSLLEESLVSEDKDCGRYEVRNGKEETVALYPETSFKGTTFIQTPYTAHYKVNKPLRAPIKEGEAVGEIEIWRQGEVVQTIPILSESSVDKISFFSQVKRGFGDLVGFFTETLY